MRANILICSLLLVMGCGSNKVVTKKTPLFTGRGHDLVVKLRVSRGSSLGGKSINEMFPHDQTTVAPLPGIVAIVKQHLDVIPAPQRDAVRMVIFADKQIPFGRLFRVLLSATKGGVLQFQVGLYEDKFSNELVTFGSGDRQAVSFVLGDPSYEIGDLVSLFSEDGTDVKRFDKPLPATIPSALGSFPTVQSLVGAMNKLYSGPTTGTMYMLFSKTSETGYVVQTLAELQGNRIKTSDPVVMPQNPIYIDKPAPKLKTPSTQPTTRPSTKHSTRTQMDNKGNIANTKTGLRLNRRLTGIFVGLLRNKAND